MHLKRVLIKVAVLEVAIQVMNDLKRKDEVGIDPNAENSSNGTPDNPTPNNNYTLSEEEIKDLVLQGVEKGDLFYDIVKYSKCITQGVEKGDLGKLPKHRTTYNYIYITNLCPLQSQCLVSPSVPNPGHSYAHRFLYIDVCPVYSQPHECLHIFVLLMFCVGLHKTSSTTSFGIVSCTIAQPSPLFTYGHRHRVLKAKHRNSPSKSH
ncbi:unnamed protein product, partial [Choristocarpus tenellus]